MLGSWDAGAARAQAALQADMGDVQAATHHHQDVEAIWPCDTSALEWLAGEAPPGGALQYCRRGARIQPNNPKWGLMIGSCLRASGRYQEALQLYKKMNARFPDDVQCLKLIVKLCGDQGLPETSEWHRELQRAQARLKNQERAASVSSVGSRSSETSYSPIDVRVDSLPPVTSSSRVSSSRDALPQLTPYSGEPAWKPQSRSRMDLKKKYDEFEGDLPLPPE